MDPLASATERTSAFADTPLAAPEEAGPLADALSTAIGLLQGAARADFAALGDEELCHTVGVIEHAGRLIDTLRALGAGEVEARSSREAGTAGLAQRHGHARGAHFLEQLTRASGAEAVRRVKLGNAIRPSRSLSGETLPAALPVLAAAISPAPSEWMRPAA